MDIASNHYAPSASTPGPRPVARAAAWIAFIVPFFYLTYGMANAFTAHREHVHVIVFAWEHYIPFLPWTVIPYWSINVLYCVSVFVCATKSELDTHAKRLLTAQVVAIACFLLFPMKFSFPEPATHGLPGLIFHAINIVDKPYNQAPSLHIAGLVILWAVYDAHVPRRAKWLLHTWFLLIGISVLTTYRHHFFDVPTGALLGVFCLWIWPDSGRARVFDGALTADRARLASAAYCVIGGSLVAALAIWIGGTGLWLLWVSVSLFLAAANYATLGADGLQRDAGGRISLPARLLFAPYLAASSITSVVDPPLS